MSFLFLQNNNTVLNRKCLPLFVEGRLIKQNSGDIFRVKGLTAFPIINRIARGEDIDWIFNLFPSANLVRAFWYTPQNEWGSSYWDLPTPDEVLKAHQILADKGIYCYNTCLTDNASSEKIEQIKLIIKKLRESSLPNILFESKNEPYTHDDLNPNVLKNDLNGSSPILYTSGIYSDDHLNEFWGKFGNNHCPRDNESVRKFKDLEEFCTQFKIPWFEGEPFKLPGYPILDFYTFAAGTGLMGSGGIYHCQSMETLQKPNQDELDYGNMFLKGLEVFPLDSQLGNYIHRQDLEGIVNNEPTTCLRCFQKGNYAIVVRKNDKFQVPNNWSSLDSYDVAYKIL